jgi:hypothetical protein
MAMMLTSIVVQTLTRVPSHSTTHFQGILGGAIAIVSGITTLLATCCSLVRGLVNIVNSDDLDLGANSEDRSWGNPILIVIDASSKSYTQRLMAGN